MDCPDCHLTNPPDAKRCSCGYSFEERPDTGNANVEDSFGFGLLIGLGLNAFVALVCGGLSALPGLKFVGLLLFGCGITQLLYLVPIYQRAWRRGFPLRAKGIIAAMAVTALLNGGCWAVGLWMLGGIGR